MTRPAARWLWRGLRAAWPYLVATAVMATLLIVGLDFHQPTSYSIGIVGLGAAVWAVAYRLIVDGPKLTRSHVGQLIVVTVVVGLVVVPLIAVPASSAGPDRPWSGNISGPYVDHNVNPDGAVWMAGPDRNVYYFGHTGALEEPGLRMLDATTGETRIVTPASALELGEVASAENEFVVLVAYGRGSTRAFGPDGQQIWQLDRAGSPSDDPDADPYGTPEAVLDDGTVVLRICPDEWHREDDCSLQSVGRSGEIGWTIPVPTGGELPYGSTLVDRVVVKTSEALDGYQEVRQTISQLTPAGEWEVLVSADEWMFFTVERGYTAVLDSDCRVSVFDQERRLTIDDVQLCHVERPGGILSRGDLVFVHDATRLATGSWFSVLNVRTGISVYSGDTYGFGGEGGEPDAAGVITYEDDHTMSIDPLDGESPMVFDLDEWTLVETGSTETVIAVRERRRSTLNPFEKSYSEVILVDIASRSVCARARSVRETWAQHLAGCTAVVFNGSSKYGWISPDGELWLFGEYVEELA